MNLLINYNSIFQICFTNPPDDVTDMPKHVGMVKDHALMYVCKYCIELFVWVNDDDRD